MKASCQRIADCAEVLPGFALKARAVHEPEGTHQLIMATHLGGSISYQYTQEHLLRVTPKGSADRYLVFPGDVLFISRGSRNLASAIKHVPELSIASATFYILRPKPDLDAKYLAWCLNQMPSQARIAQVRTGAATPIVQRSLLGEIRIPIPPIEQQRKIVKLAELMESELDLRQKLVDKTVRLHRIIGQRLLADIK